MLLRKLWRTMGQYKAQFISMVLMIAHGIGIFVGFNMEWYSIEQDTLSFFRQTGFADYRIVSEAGFDESALQAIEAIDGVDAASRYLSVTADVAEREGDTVAMTVTENAAVSGFYLMEGERYDPQSPDGIWLSDQYAHANDLQVGDSLTLSYKNISFSGKIRGLIKSGEHMICVRDETQLMPDFRTHGFAYLSTALYETASGMEYYPQINVRSGLSKRDFTEAVDAALQRTTLILTRDETIAYSGSQGESEEGKTMGSILPVLFLLIAVLTMVTTMHRLAAKEKTQIGTLKALGFKDRRILRHYTSYAFLIGTAGTAIGIGLGYWVAYFIMNPNGMMSTYMDLPKWKLCFPWFCYLILAGILALLTLIGYLSVRKMLKGTAAEALRPYAPKRMKPLLIERTRAFHRLGFGTRWNLRDTMRHKSRTAMSLIGIIGCMMILVCALGMRDTMNAFLDLYYDGATNYSSRIYLSEETDDAQRAEIVEKYEGDWSASVSVQLEEKAISLDIYDISHDKVRFPDQDNRYISLRDDGAYVCIRLSEEFDLQPGDRFTVSPYGSDVQYTLTVAGIDRSISENIVITAAYADTLGIPYTVSSVYTDTQKADVQATEAIKSVQSKQMVMDSFDSFMELMNTMILVMVVGAMLLGVIVLYNLGVMSYTERYREMATLKVVGFRDRKIGRLLITQNLWLSIIGILIGLPFGMFVLDYMLKALASEYELKMVLGPVTYILSVLLTLGVSLSVSFLVARKNRKIDMVEALKGAE